MIEIKKVARYFFNGIEHRTMDEAMTAAYIHEVKAVLAEHAVAELDNDDIIGIAAASLEISQIMIPCKNNTHQGIYCSEDEDS